MENLLDPCRASGLWKDLQMESGLFGRTATGAIQLVYESPWIQYSAETILFGVFTFVTVAALSLLITLVPSMTPTGARALGYALLSVLVLVLATQVWLFHHKLDHPIRILMRPPQVLSTVGRIIASFFPL